MESKREARPQLCRLVSQGLDEILWWRFSSEEGRCAECSLAEVTQQLEICQNKRKSVIGTINEELITMPAPAAIPIVLSPAQQEILEQIVRCLSQ